MNHEHVAHFIAELRKSKQMTQKDLAERLHITDKAVSKWERGLSCPDISLLAPLAEILGVTTAELLNGQRHIGTPSDATEEIVETALDYAGQVNQMKEHHLRSAVKHLFSLSCLTAVIICIICDTAISGRLTWSLFPVYSVIFAWLVLFPLLHFKTHYIRMSLLSLSIFIVPFLFALNTLTDTGGLLIQLGIRISLLSIVFLWMIYFLFSSRRTNGWNAAAITALLVIPLAFLINLMISTCLNAPLFDIWDILSCVILAVSAVIFFAAGQFKSKSA